MKKIIKTAPYIIAAMFSLFATVSHAGTEKSTGKESHFSTLREHAIERQTYRLGVMQKELECTKQAQNYEQLRACVNTARSAVQEINAKSLAEARRQYSLQNNTTPAK